MAALDLECGDAAFQIKKWEDELAKETKSALKDMAEVEDADVEAEAAAFTAKLLFLVTDGDWKQAEGIASVLESFFSEQTAGSEIEMPEEIEASEQEEGQADEEDVDEASDTEKSEEDGDGEEAETEDDGDRVIIK
ncbi:hypothetical protein [Haloplanus natans]|uniref:hypothetical protein n=1 Tax=Haloplanus natans TaxID=376171 RepID=UPI00067801BB|nr:hypothetical protein [Haloplanus natans]